MPAGINDVGVYANLLTIRGFETFTVDASVAQGLTPPQGAQLALLNTYNEDARFRDDGIDPTASIGQPIIKLSTLQYNIEDLTKIKIIAVTGTTQINVTYYSFPRASEA